MTVPVTPPYRAIIRALRLQSAANFIATAAAGGRATALAWPRRRGEPGELPLGAGQ